MILRYFASGKISDPAERLTRIAAYMLGFSIPISTAMDSLLVLLLPLLWLSSTHFDTKFTLIRANRAAMLAMALMAVITVGLLYGNGTLGDRLDMFGRYGHLLFIALLVPIFQETDTRRRALIGFMAALILTLILSYLIAFSVLPVSTIFTGTPQNPTVFKLQITQNLFLAYGGFAFAVAARYESRPWRRLLYVLLVALTVYNVLFMGTGRTGYLVLGALMVYFCFDWLGRKGIIVATATIIVLAGTAYFGSSSLHTRINLAEHQMITWHPGHPAGDGNSIGDRLEFYRNSVALIREHPVFGVGTGGFAEAYAEKIKGSGMLATRNPHNQFLLITIQLGLVGLAALLYFFFRLWQLAQQLVSGIDRNLARGLILLILVGGLVNSLLMDHAESLLFAWMTGVLYSGLRPRDSGGPGNSP
ncbi:MAG: O-antigen ligase family protein [Acidiferrobacterales bacterium]